MKKLLVAIVLIGVIAIGGYFYWQTTPDYTLSQIKTAIKERDTVKFKEYVDVHSVAASVVDGALSEPVQALMAGNIFGKMLFAGLLGLVKPDLTNTFEKEILEAVQNGSIKSKDSSTSSVGASAPGGAGPTFSNMSGKLNLGRKKFKSIKTKTQSGDSAIVGLLFVDQDTQSEFVLNCKMVKSEASWPPHWVIVSIENCADVMIKLSEIQGSKQRIEIQQEEVEIN